MARLVGIDIGKTQIRAIRVRTGRRPSIEKMLEADCASAGSLEQAVRAVAAPLVDHQVERLAVALSGEQTFIHRLELPTSARKQLAEVVPFELEAQLPVELDELVFDHRMLDHHEPGSILVLAAAARIESVQERIELVARAVGREPDRVGCGALPLGQLVMVWPELAESRPVALIDLEAAETEVAVVAGGQVVFGRTLSVGMQDLPEGAPRMVSELGQSLLAWATLAVHPVERIFLVGSGSSDPNACSYLGHALGLPVQLLPPPGWLSPEQAAVLPGYAKALGLALSLERPRDLNLRRGVLAPQRRYHFLKQKAPVLAGLGTALLISIGFAFASSWYALGREQELLSSTLEALTQEVLGEKTQDPERARELLERGRNAPVADPMPHADAFDVLVKLSQGIPSSLTHDIEEFELARGHVKLVGVVDTQADAQKVASMVKEWACVREAKIGKITQVVNSSRQKYTLEFDLRCPEDETRKTSKKAAVTGKSQ